MYREDLEVLICLFGFAVVYRENPGPGGPVTVKILERTR